jgi:endonuclease YncB( thermonuclease family)
MVVADQEQPQGWHPDPWEQAEYRWWNGSQWTEHTQGAVLPPTTDVAATEARTATAGVAAAKPWWQRGWAITLAGFAVLVVLIVVTGDDDAEDATAALTAAEDQEDPAEPEPEPDPQPEPESDSDPEPEPEPEPEPDPEPEPELEPEPEPGPSGDVWTVTNIVDGDTIDVQRGSRTERVRVIGIDTPERAECGFGPASSALSALILDEEVVLTAGARDDRDRYDRILRYIDIGDTDAGLSLIEQGLAIARYDSRDGYGRHPREDTYIAADDATAHRCDLAAPAAEPEPEPAPTPPPPSSGPGSGAGGAWKNCTEARDAGAAPVYRGDPGYGSHLDRDDDGIGCE